LRIADCGFELRTSTDERGYSGHVDCEFEMRAKFLTDLPHIFLTPSFCLDPCQISAMPEGNEVRKMGSEKLAAREEGLSGVGKGDRVKLALAPWVRRVTAMNPEMCGAAGACGRLAPRLQPVA
jgi:hypothetical protein